MTNHSPPNWMRSSKRLRNHKAHQGHSGSGGHRGRLPIIGCHRMQRGYTELIQQTSSALRPKARLSARLRHQLGVLQGRLERAAAALAAAPVPAAIHKTRVAARRLRVLLRAYSRELDSKERKRYLRELEGLTSDLEPAREADVAKGLILRLARDRSGGMDGHRERYTNTRGDATKSRSMRCARPWCARLGW